MDRPLNFVEEKNGYSKLQVDTFVEKVMREYKRLHHEHKVLSGKVRQLEQELAQMTHEKKAASGLAAHFRVKISQLERENARLSERPAGQMPELADEVTRVLMDAELLAQQIVERAKQKASEMTQEAQAEQDRILAAKERLLDEIKNDWEILRVGTL